MTQAYKGPGVFVKETPFPQPVSIAGSARIVGIVGKGSTNYLIENVEVVRGTGTTDAIPSTVSGDNITVVGIGDIPGYNNYIKDTDFTVSDNNIDWSLSGEEPTAAASYYVSYRKLKGASFYEPTLYYSIDDVRTNYGPELDNGIINEIPLAASIAFDSGASQVICVQQVDDTVTEQKAAIDKLETEEVTVLLAPGMTSTTLQSYILSHVNKMNSYTERKERVFLTSGLNLDDTIAEIKARAAAFNNQLVTVCAPATCEVTLKDGTLGTESTIDVSGAYAMASLAGVMADPAYDEAEPLTRKVLTDIVSLSNVKYKESEMNDLASNGVLVLTNDSGIIRVRHAVTTSTANVNEIELSVVSIKMDTKKQIRTTLAPYIGIKYIGAETNSLIAAAVKSFCEQKVAAQVYSPDQNGADPGYRNITVKQSTTDPRVALIHFEFRPVYTLTWEEVTFSLYVS
jgi:hypothetical protein